MRPALAVTMPNPIEAVGNGLSAIGNGIGGVLGRGAASVGGSLLDAVGDAIARGLATAARKVSDALLGFLATATGPNFEAGWWAGARGQRLFASVAALAAVLMVACALLALLQGLLAGDPGGMVRSVLTEVPISVFGTAVLMAVTQVLIGVTDAASAMVLDRVPADLGQFFNGFAVSANVVSNGLVGAVLLGLFLLGALLVWIELVVRSSLIYLLVAFAPLALAARVWPAARGTFRKLCELGLALIVSKFAIALALGLGAAALGGGGPSGNVAEGAALSISALLAGGSLMVLAAFTPFVVLRLLPIVETAVVAQGISRSPARAGQTAMQGAYYAEGLRRMGERRGSPPRLGSGPPGSSAGGHPGASPGGGPGQPPTPPPGPPPARPGPQRPGPTPGRPPAPQRPAADAPGMPAPTDRGQVPVGLGAGAARRASADPQRQASTARPPARVARPAATPSGGRP